MNTKVIIIIFLFIQSCSENKNPVISSLQYKEFAHGFWKAVSGDTLITGEIGLIACNWYAIDTRSKSDSVYVTWDDGIACTKTGATMKENIIEMLVNKIHTIFLENEIQTKFIIKNDKEASVTFNTSSNIYKKKLLKLRNDPRVLCD